MIDSMVSLAFAVFSNKGAYALLLGSGISRASEIPTGWEVVLDLIRKVAKLEGEDCEPDPAAWFRQKHSVEPDYSMLLHAVAKTPTERQQLLRGYFEPTEEERTQGLKLPSAAHKAIAQLVAGGHLRVIITTNFDRLTEKALEEAGVAATVISTTDQLAGALPLAHSGATVIKLHGDYLDTRIKNTETELATYDKSINSLLDRVFDEYGLIVSGWSADWDIALRSAMERCPSRRFTTYWATRSPLGEKAKGLVERRQAVVLQTKDANQLFSDLREKIRSLEDMGAPHPLSAKLAVATVKRLIVDASAKIRLRDMVHAETEKLVVELCTPTFSAQTQLQPAQEVPNRVEKYEALCEILLSMMVAGCYWSTGEATERWTSTIHRVANATEKSGGFDYLLNLHQYPTLLLLYGAGLAAVAAGNDETLVRLLTRPKVKGHEGKYVEICSMVYPDVVMELQYGRLLPGMERRYRPVSDHLFNKLRSLLREYLPSDEDYQGGFDRFEYLLGLVHANLNHFEAEGGWWGPVGRFHRLVRHTYEDGGISRRIGTELEAQGENWPLLRAGLFGGSLEQAKMAKAKFDSWLSQCRY